eukprot:7245500-Alexandrium_andersonii.AAC.1
MESECWEHVARMVNNVVSWATDLGTESAFPFLPTANLRQVFPWIPHDDFEIYGAADFAAAGGNLPSQAAPPDCAVEQLF